MTNKCNICGEHADVVSGGCAIMMAFCRKHTTNLLNVSFCAECYENLLAEPMRKLNDSACLNLILDEDVEK